MNIHIVFVMHTLGREPYELVQALAGQDTTFHVFLHSQEPQAEEYFYLLPQVVSNVRLNHVGFNRGLSYSWNQGLLDAQAEGADILMIANDDVYANRTDMLRVAQAALDVGHEYYYINGQGLHIEGNLHAGLQFALAAITPLALNTIGYFDQNIFPIYHEDSDWYRRAELAGLKPYTIGETSIQHMGSQTLRKNERVLHQLEIAVPRNEQYMLRKWGGTIEHYVYDKPFNDPRFDLKIQAENRFVPYPGYDRIDYDEIVRMA